MIKPDCFMIIKNRTGAVDEFYIVDFGWIMFGTPRIPTLPYCEFMDNGLGSIIKNADISHANYCNSEYIFGLG